MPLGNGQPIRKSTRVLKFSKRLLGWLMVGWLFGGNPAMAAPTTVSEPTPNAQGGIVSACPAGQCPVRVSSFGYYPTQWRSWARERRPDRFFPQSIGLEAIPTPEPGPMPELPRQKISPEKPSLPPLPKLPTELPLTPPEEKQPPAAGPSQLPGLPTETPFQIEERSPLEGIQSTPLEPRRPGPEKPPVQMPLPLEPMPKPATQMPLPLEPAQKPGTQTPLPLEPMPQPSLPTLPPAEALPTGKVPGTGPAPAQPAPSEQTPPLPSASQQPAGPPDLPPPAEPPSGSKSSAEPGPEKPNPSEKTSHTVPPTPYRDVASGGLSGQPLAASSLPPTPSPSTNASRAHPRSSSSSPTPRTGLQAIGSPVADSPPTWDHPLRDSSGSARDVPAISQERMGSRSASVHDPLEPWAEPRPWHPSEPASQNFRPSGAEGFSAPSEPEPPLMEATQVFQTPHDAGPAQAAFQTELPPAQQTNSALPRGSPTGNYELEGYCPVSLLEKEQWVPGDPQFAVHHQGKVYLLAGPTQRQRFLANPNRYVPVGGGIDPVLAVEENRHLPGRTDYCVVYDGRLYLFSSQESLARFHQNPKKYATFARSGL